VQHLIALAQEPDDRRFERTGNAHGPEDADLGWNAVDWRAAEDGVRRLRQAGDRAAGGGAAASGLGELGICVAAALARWREAALASKGPGGAVCRLAGVQLERLRAALDAGPAACGVPELGHGS
jgi:hypothetical protein